MFRISLLSLAMCIVTMGCSQTMQKGPIAKVADWPSARDHLGKTALLFDASQDDRFLAKSSDALGKLSGTHLADPSPILATLGPEALCRPVSDVKLVEAARLQHFDTVCLLQLDDVSYNFSIVLAVPPPITATGTFAYRLRVLDVHSGRLLIDAQRQYTSEGQSHDAFRKAMPDLLASDLTSILADSSCTRNRLLAK